MASRRRRNGKSKRASDRNGIKQNATEAGELTEVAESGDRNGDRG